MKCVCPDSNLEKHERIREIFRNIEEWIQSDALQSLVRLFGGEKMETAPLKAQIQWLNNFVEIWDYRSRNQNTDVNERWNVFDDEFVLKHKDEIMNCAKTGVSAGNNRCSYSRLYHSIRRCSLFEPGSPNVCR